jgi:RNA polymerase sigma factor (sigma-70 family)
LSLVRLPSFAALTSEARYNGWVREHYRFLFRSAWALSGSRSLAEDIVQDCFTLAWRHRDQLRDAALARAWLFRILRRCAIRHAPPPGTASIDADEEFADRRVADDARLDEKLDVVRALARLSPMHREVLVLFYFDDMPTARMAEALDVAPGTVLSRLARARDALKRVLEPGVPATANVTPIRKADHA